jgi:hypothetical protein
MPQYLPLPDGNSVTIQPGETPQQTWARALQMYPASFGGKIKEETPEVAPKTGIGSALIGGAQRYGSQFRTGLGGGSEAAEAGVARMEEIEKARPSQVSLEKVKQAYEKDGVLSAAGEALGQIPYAIAEQVPQLASMGAGARAGAMAGRFLGPVGAAAGTGLGALAGQFLSSYVPTAGANLEAQARAQIAEGKPVDVNSLAAYGAAVPGAALDVFTDRLLLGKGVLGRMLGFTDDQVAKKSAQELEKLASEKLLPKLSRGEASAGTLLKGTAKGTVEVPIGITQQMLERAQAGLPLTNDEALAEYGNTAFQAILTSPLGGLGRVSERGGARSEIAERKKQAADAAFAAQEAEKNRPENLLKLHDEYIAAKDEGAKLTQVIEQSKPNKKKDPKAYAEWEETSAGLREQSADLTARITELHDEYLQRKDLINPLVAQRQAEQPAAAPVEPPAPPPVTELMDQYDALNQQRDQVYAQMRDAASSGDFQTVLPLRDQWQALGKQVNEFAKAVEEAGGTTETVAVLDKKIGAAQKELAKALEVDDGDAIGKQSERLVKLQEKRALVEGREPAVAEQPEVAPFTMPPVTKAPITPQVPLLENKPLSMPKYVFPDGTVATTPYDVERYEEEQFQKKYGLQAVEASAPATPLEQATQFVRDTAKVSVSHLAEGLGIKKQAAAQLIMDLEKAGVVTPPMTTPNNQTKRRFVIPDPSTIAGKLENKPFTKYVFPDGTVATTPEEVKAYEEAQFQRKYAPQPIEKPAPTTAVSQPELFETPEVETPTPAETPAPAEAVEQPQGKTETSAETKPAAVDLSALEQKNKQAKDALTAIGPEPRKPSPEKKFFGAAGREKAAPEIVNRYDAEVKAYDSWKRKYTKLKKDEVNASNALFNARKTLETAAPVEAAPVPQGSLAQEAQQGSLFREKGEKPTVGMRVADVDTQIAPFRELPVAPRIETVQSVSELPPEIQEQMERDGTQSAPGMFHPPTKTIYMVGDNLIDSADAGKTIAHELVGHFGLRGVLDKQYPAVMRAIYQNSKQIRAEANARMQRNPNLSQEVATEESVAERAEKDVSLNWMHRLTNLIRTKLRQWGIWKGAPIGDSEIIRLIRDSHKYVHGVTTKPSETVRALAKIAPEGRPTAPAGEALYRTKKPTKSVVAQRTSAADDLMSLYTGLTGASSRDATLAGIKDKTNIRALKLRQSIFDGFASLEEVVKKGVEDKKIDALRAQNLMFALRFGQQRSDIVGQTVTSGPPRVRSEKTKAGTEYFYENDANGPTLIGMAQALEKAKGYKEEDRENALTVYLAGKRAEQVGWNKLRFDNPVEAENEYKAVLAHLKQNKADEAAFKEAEKIYQNYNAGLLDFLVQTGAMSKQKAAELKSITYVPFYRVDKDGNIRMETGDERRSIRIGNIKSEPRLKELLGDSEQILPVFTSAVQNTSMLINMAMRNQTVKDTAFVLKDLGIASRIVASKGPYTDNVVHFRVHGVEHHAIIDTDMYGIPAQMIVEGLEGIKLAMPAIVRMFGVPGDIFRKFTVRNPLYMFRQLVRDPVSAWVQNGTDTIPILDSFSTLAKMATGKDTIAQRLQRSGATSSNVLVGDARDMTKFLEDLTAGKWSLQRVFSKLDTVAQQADAATRQVIYEDSLKKGMSHQQALMRTLESMNFSRRGTSPSMYLLASLTPFMHSQVQSLDVLYRSMRGQLPGADKLQVAQRFAARATMLAMSSVAYALLMQDDEDYKRAKPEERYGYWWVPTLGLTKENWLKIPIPYEIGFLFKALPEAIVNMAFGDEKVGPGMEALGRMLSQSQPLSMPQAIKPITEVMLGSSFYSGPIESPHEKEILPEKRYRTNSTELSKMLGGVAGLSPIQIDYLIRGYTGGVGMAITQMANVFLRAPEAENIAKPTTKLSEVPLIGALFQTSEGRGALDATYKLIEEIQQYKGAYNKLIEDQRFEDAAKFANENASVLAASSMAGYMKKTLGEMSKQARMIKSDPKMTTEQKDAALENLYINQLAQSRNFLKNAERTTLR